MKYRVVLTCASCETTITHNVVLAGGQCYCCPGCVAGGPCVCTYELVAPGRTAFPHSTMAYTPSRSPSLN